MTASIGPPPVATEWRLQHVRITAFHLNSQLPNDIEAWWFAAFDKQPERIEHKPQENARLFAGRVQHGRLTCQSVPGRTDFILEHEDAPGATNSSPWPAHQPNSYQDTMSYLVNVACTWLQNGQSTYRLAVAPVLLSPSPDLHTAHATLSGFLPKIEFTGIVTPDFTLRVNRTRQAVSLPEIAVNRLATWSVAQAQQFAIAPDIAEFRVSPVDYAAQLELDVNTRTVPETRFSTSEASVMLKELRDMACEIAQEGDGP